MANSSDINNAIPLPPARDQQVTRSEVSTSSQALNVCLVGADKRVRAVMESVFKRAGTGYFRISDADDARAVIANIDGDETEAAFMAHREKFPAHHALILTFGKRGVAPGDIVLEKPILLPRLIASLDWLRKKAQLPSRNVSPDSSSDVANHVALGESCEDDEPTLEMTVVSVEAPNSPADRTGESDSAGIDSKNVRSEAALEIREPSHTLTVHEISQGHLAVAGSVQSDLTPVEYLGIEGSLLEAAVQAHALSEYARTPVEVCHDDVRLMVFDPRSCQVSPCFPMQKFRDLCQRGEGKYTTKATDASSAIISDSSGSSRAEHLLFSMGLWTFDGRLPEGTDLDYPVYLRYWPNFTRLPGMPNAMRIAALWRMRATALSRTAQELRIPRRHVFDFYSACWAVGLSNHTRRSADVILEPEELLTNRRRALFERVVDHIDKSIPASPGKVASG